MGGTFPLSKVGGGGIKKLLMQRFEIIIVEDWRVVIIITYNYFTGKLREVYFTKGSQDQIFVQNI